MKRRAFLGFLAGWDSEICGGEFSPLVRERAVDCMLGFSRSLNLTIPKWKRVTAIGRSFDENEIPAGYTCDCGLFSEHAPIDQIPGYPPTGLDQTGIKTFLRMVIQIDLFNDRDELIAQKFYR